MLTCTVCYLCLIGTDAHCVGARLDKRMGNSNMSDDYVQFTLHVYLVNLATADARVHHVCVSSLLLQKLMYESHPIPLMLT